MRDVRVSMREGVFLYMFGVEYGGERGGDRLLTVNTIME